MSVQKADLYKLVEKMNEKETVLAYNIFQNIINNKDINDIAVADNTPLTSEEKAELAEVIKEETVKWEDVKRELDL